MGGDADVVEDVGVAITRVVLVGRLIANRTLATASSPLVCALDDELGVVLVMQT
jgi:hypothetical protein